MSHVELTTRVGPDGVLELRVPLGIDAANQLVSVTVDASSAVPANHAKWQTFIESIAGSIEDETFVRHEQGTYEDRGELFP